MVHSVADKVYFRPVTLFDQFGSYSLMQSEKLQVSTLCKVLVLCFRSVGLSTFLVFGFDPLRHVLGTFVQVVTQHAASKVGAP
jgi:hypothetical protein